MLARLSPGSKSLLEASAEFAFHDIPTDLIHPSVTREGCFPSGVVMPVAELPPQERVVVVSGVITRSLVHITMDSLEAGLITGHPSKVSDPKAYLDLLKTGKKVHRANEQRGPLADPDNYTGESIHPHIVAGVVYRVFTRMTPCDSTKFALKQLSTAEPKLGPDETKESRSALRNYTREQKLMRGRYARTLGLAFASAVLAFNGHASAETARVVNQPQIEALQAERQTVGPDQVEEIDKQLGHLKAQNTGDATLWLIVGAGALARFGMWRLGRPKPPEQLGTSEK